MLDINELKINRKYYKEYFSQIKELYLEAFPITERVPLELLFELNNTDVLVFTYQSKFIGFAIMLDWNNISYLLYFAINSKYQGKGFGSQALELIKKEKNNMTILADIEFNDQQSLNSKQRVKRKKFYLNLGFMETGITYVQKNIKFEILFYGESVTKKSIDDFWNSVPHELYKYYKE